MEPGQPEAQLVRQPSAAAPFQRILVAGGAGFLGSNLCRRLVNDGHEVICLDNFFTGTKMNVSDLVGKPNFELIRHDVTEPLLLEVDQIYNLACPASPPHYQYDTVKTLRTSFLGALNMLELGKKCRARVLQTSTSEVYGDPDITPQTESYWGNVNPIGVRSCYDEGKRVSETLFREFRVQEGVDTRIVRIFNTYGPGMHPHDGRVISNFIMQALAGDDITLYGDGSQTRSFCFVSDQVDGLIKMMNNPNAHPGPINIGNPNEFTIRELAALCIELTGSKSQLIQLPLPGDDPKQRCPDITLARKELDWEPSVQLREGLEKTIAYFAALDKSKFKKPTSQTAHQNTTADQKREEERELQNQAK
eukprot:TRINITY_DN5158_c0_g1_i1.p1 TRINITY_DN5158_c0_g1~~TRINITY_DN5158_c0_g1_i1.p1  ORF type:complete len:363 (+),score=74.69 TRINITY_DN5158_c0_g1_i1:175-1263(+)